MSIYKYRIYCNTDDRYEYIWDFQPPTSCPIDATHSIDVNSVKSVDQEYFRSGAPPTNLNKYNKITEYIPPMEKGKILTVNNSNSRLAWEYPHTHRIRNFTFGVSNYASKSGPVGSGIIKNSVKNSTVSSIIGAFIFDGTNADDSISSIKAIIYDADGNIGSKPLTAKIRLIAGITEIAQLSIDNQQTPINILSNDGNIVTTSTISNLPTNEKLIKIQLELTLGNTPDTYYIGVTQIIINL